jgi:ubiquinone biosynthesis monooxygenase Coq7
MLGALAGIAGDRFSLGFVAETERQVVAHLQAHLKELPVQDKKSQAILELMHEDEAQHAEVAKAAGAFELPFLIQHMMQWTSKLMTYSSYYL